MGTTLKLALLAAVLVQLSNAASIKRKSDPKTILEYVPVQVIYSDDLDETLLEGRGRNLPPVDDGASGSPQNYEEDDEDDDEDEDDEEDDDNEKDDEEEDADESEDEKEPPKNKNKPPKKAGGPSGGAPPKDGGKPAPVLDAVEDEFATPSGLDPQGGSEARHLYDYGSGNGYGGYGNGMLGSYLGGYRHYGYGGNGHYGHHGYGQHHTTYHNGFYTTIE